jgi:chloride channel protein, CIC family
MAPPELVHYPWYALLGVLLGAAGVLLNRMLLRALDLFAVWSRRAGWSLVLFLATSLTLLLFRQPLATGGGEQIIPPMLAQHAGEADLLALFALRGLATVASYAAGAPGGVFAPILGLATVAGLAYGELLSPWLSQPGLQPAALAAAAMAALFTGSVRAPLVGVVLVAELTDGYPALLAITLSSAMASLTAARLGGRPLYELLLERSLSRS